MLPLFTVETVSVIYMSVKILQVLEWKILMVQLSLHFFLPIIIYYTFHLGTEVSHNAPAAQTFKYDFSK